MRRFTCVLVVLASLTMASEGIALADPLGAQGSLEARTVGVARFEGTWIDLSRGWGLARACLVFPGLATECFRTSGAMERRARDLSWPDLSCSTPLKLRDLTYQGGTLVSVYTRGLWIDLSAVGFDNRTSSYTVGACAVELASLPGGGGFHYPRCLYAGCVENVMANGWDNVVSSVYLH